jgi:hypothetical protein
LSVPERRVEKASSPRSRSSWCERSSPALWFMAAETLATCRGARSCERAVLAVPSSVVVANIWMSPGSWPTGARKLIAALLSLGAQPGREGPRWRGPSGF